MHWFPIDAMEYVGIAQIFYYPNFCDITIFFVLICEPNTNLKIITRKKDMDYLLT